MAGACSCGAAAKEVTMRVARLLARLLVAATAALLLTAVFDPAAA